MSFSKQTLFGVGHFGEEGMPKIYGIRQLLSRQKKDDML